MTDAAPRSFAFIFPMMSGHINPSLPVARALVAAGHDVHYLSREQMRQAIEDTGARFHSDVEQEPELYSGRELSFAPSLVLKREHDLEEKTFTEIRASLQVAALELAMPGCLRWLQQVRADAIFYDPLVNLEAPYAGAVLGIPSVALLTLAGPGAYTKVIEALLEVSGCTHKDLLSIVDSYQPHLAAVSRMNRDYGLGLQARDGYAPLGHMPQLRYSAATVITTSQDLQDPIPAAMEQAYHKDGVRFEAVGPLLDVEGSCRAAGHKQEEDGSGHAEAASSQTQIMFALRAATAAGRPVVLVSMGTMITGDSAVGWHARDATTDGSQRGLSGRELCQSAWGGAFDAFGCAEPQQGPLLLVALGPQPDALGTLEVPANCFAVPSLPQVDILKAGVNVFLTHGGQNSFTEALATGVPLVVCPGFGDQLQNAGKAESLGVGLQVPRPHPEADAIASAAVKYRADVAQALTDVCSRQSFAVAVAGCRERLRQAGGVPRVVELMLEVAQQKRQEASKVADAAAKPVPVVVGAEERRSSAAAVAGA